MRPPPHSDSRGRDLDGHGSVGTAPQRYIQQDWGSNGEPYTDFISNVINNYPLGGRSSTYNHSGREAGVLSDPTADPPSCKCPICCRSVGAQPELPTSTPSILSPSLPPNTLPLSPQEKGLSVGAITEKPHQARHARRATVSIPPSLRWSPSPYRPPLSLREDDEGVEITIEERPEYQPQSAQRVPTTSLGWSSSPSPLPPSSQDDTEAAAEIMIGERPRYRPQPTQRVRSSSILSSSSGQSSPLSYRTPPPLRCYTGVAGGTTTKEPRPTHPDRQTSRYAIPTPPSSMWSSPISPPPLSPQNDKQAITIGLKNGDRPGYKAHPTQPTRSNLLQSSISGKPPRVPYHSPLSPLLCAPLPTAEPISEERHQSRDRRSMTVPIPIPTLGAPPQTLDRIPPLPESTYSKAGVGDIDHGVVSTFLPPGLDTGPSVSLSSSLDVEVGSPLGDRVSLPSASPVQPLSTTDMTWSSSPIGNAACDTGEMNGNSDVVQQVAPKLPQIEGLLEGNLPKPDRREPPPAPAPVASVLPLSSLLSDILGSPSSTSSSTSSVLGVPSGLLGLETGFNKPRFSKIDAKTMSALTRIIEGELQDLHTQELDGAGLGNATSLTQLLQDLERRVFALEAQMRRMSPESIKPEARGIRNDLKRILPQIQPEYPHKFALGQSLSMLAVLARALFLLPECEHSKDYFILSKSCLVLAKRFVPSGHKVEPIIASHQGTLYLRRFQFFGRKKDIKRAIKYHHQSITAVANHHPKRAMFLGWLGRCHLALFEDNQDAAELKRGIEYSSDAWKDIQSKAKKATNEERKHIFEGKGCALQCLLEHVGGLNNMGIINSGIEEWRSILLDLLKQPDTEGSIKAGCMKTLGFLYTTRFGQLGGWRHSDLEKSLTFLAAAVTLQPKQDSSLRSTLCILARSLAARSNSCTPRNSADSDLALKFLNLAKQLTPKDHVFVPHLLANFGDVHASLSCKGDDDTHLNAAIKYYTGALNHPLCRPGSRLWAKARQKLGLCCLYKYSTVKRRNYDRSMKYLRLALGEFVHVALSPRGHLFDRFTAACSWATNAASHPSFRAHALYGYETTMELIPLLACFGAVPGQRYKATQKSGQLAVEAAAIAIEAKEYTLALTLLEQGRSVKWNHMLQLQTPLYHLKLHPQGQALAEELEALLIRLQLEESTSSSESNEQSHHEDLDLQNRYQQVLGKIRRLPGFANFMRPKLVEDLIKAARNGPVVVINVHESRCDALIVHPIQRNTGIQHIPLPALSPDGIIKMRNTIEQSLGDIENIRIESGNQLEAIEPIMMTLENQLKNLWDWVVNPILEGLDYKPRSMLNSSLPRITWCATGPLSFLPLHAAGDYRDSGQKKTFEYVVSSYTPTLSALLSDPAYDAPGKSPCEILLVNPGKIPGERPLPGAKEEIERTSKHFEEAQKKSWQGRLTQQVWQIMGYQAPSCTQKDSMDGQPDRDSDEEYSSESDEGTSYGVLKPEEPERRKDKPRCTRLEGPDANPVRVYEEMQKHDWVHLACHAEQNDGDPAKCVIRLRDGDLSLQKIARMRYKKRGLAFLSACETAKGDRILPDEAVHLASGMLMTGYSSVIAAMWSVMDHPAVEVADLVYKRLLVEDRMDCSKSAIALHSALDGLRKKGVLLSDWIPYVHFGN
ncbi:hypothetical protein FRC11_013657 [Ceratobasidium sp. 423]|nr:hypothetical protein FRC11_013657 [Ceratobasidium sp. 423]